MPNGKDQPPDAEVLAQSQDGIAKHRQGDGTIVVRDAAGQPVAGAKVTIEQLRHDFLFGCNLFQFGHCDNPEQEAAYRQQFAAVFNYCTLGFYWASYESERGRPGYAYTDSVVEWTGSHGIACKGHPLAWSHPASSPAWLPDDDAEIERLSLARVSEIISRYRGRIDIWDVVNEATVAESHTHQTKMARWAATLDPVEYVFKHLQVARAANPQAVLLVNDDRTDPAYSKILEGQRAGGNYIFDAIGIQSHMPYGVWPLAQVREICDTYARLGRPIHFTETTIISGARRKPGQKGWPATTAGGEASQAEKTANFYTTLFAHPAVHAVTWWDFSDSRVWNGAPAGWLRRDMSPKPVYDRLRALIQDRWWTKGAGRTNMTGTFKARAFYGAYRITAEFPGGARTIRQVHWERGSRNLFELTAPSGQDHS